MKTTGIIFAGLDCDADAIEDWNRWYDLEHLPPNIALQDVMHGRRYVAPPSHQELRPEGCDEAFSGGRSAFLTIYWLCGDVDGVMATMTEYREVLVDADRMFPDEKKIVRLGDALALNWAVADPALKADPGDIPTSPTPIFMWCCAGVWAIKTGTAPSTPPPRWPLTAYTQWRRSLPGSPPTPPSTCT